jgi:hypothetical protein
MLEVKAWVYGKLCASTALITALGNVDRIEFFYPQNPAADFPKLTYSEPNQPSDANYDDKPTGVESTIEIHVWSAANMPTTPICKIVDLIMIGLYFNVDESVDYQEPDTRINHRVLRYRRLLTALDLL